MGIIRKCPAAAPKSGRAPVTAASHILIKTAGGMGVQSDVRFLWGGYDEGRYCGYAQDWYTLDSRVVLLKGGAGTGKSTLMKRVRERWLRQGRETVSFYCSADPSSLDAVCTADRRLCIMDATAPHAREARFPAAVERLADLGSCLDGVKLREQLPRLTELTARQQDRRLRAGQYLRAAAVLARQEVQDPENRPSESALLRCAGRLARQAFGGERGEGGDRRAYLSGITPDGGVVFYDTLTALCPQVYVLEDDPGPAARLLALLQHKAALAGVPTITCPCALRPDCIEHLLMPSVGAAFTTSDRFHEVDFPVYRHLSMLRCRERPLSAQERHRRELGRRTQQELLAEATELLAGAREDHRREEEIYQAAMDWEQAACLTEQVAAWLT